MVSDSLLKIVGALLVILTAFTPGAAAGESVPGKLLVELTGAPTPDLVRRLAADGARFERRLGKGRFAVVDIGKNPAPEIRRRLDMQPDILAVSPVYIRRLAATFPNDPRFSTHQWGLHNTGQPISLPGGSASGTPDADIDAPEAWDLTTGTQAVVVAVIDTGIALTNPSLAPNLWSNGGEVAGDDLDNDGNGYVDDVYGYDFSLASPSPQDVNGHGSFCAGIVGARGNDGVGVTGVNWRVSLMALKIFGPSGTATDADAIEAIEYAADNGAHVINASWGSGEWSAVLAGAIRSAGERGVLFVAAAGNDGACMKEFPFYPAAYTLPNLLSVGSTNFRDEWSAFSNYDDTLVDALAPGELVYSTRISSDSFGSGTSYAAPHVAGVAGLLLAQEPELSPERVRARLRSAADQRSSLFGRTATGGRISAWKALALAGSDTDSPAVVGDLASSSAGQNGFLLTFTAPGDDGTSGSAAWYDIRLSTSPISDASFHLERRVFHAPSPSPAGTPESLFVTELEPATTYYFRTIAGDQAGNVSAPGNELVVTTPDRFVWFADDMEQGESQWEAEGGFSRTNEAAHRGDWCWSDSPGGNYTSNTVTTLTSVPFSLASSGHPWLRFHHQYVFDRSIMAVGDRGEVQVTTDSVNYRTIRRFVSYATPWRHVLINLKEFAGEPNVRLRFRFESNGVNEADGWHVDDVEVFDGTLMVPEPADFVLESRTPFEMTASPDYLETGGEGVWGDSAFKAVNYRLRGRQTRVVSIDPLPPAATARFTPLFSADGWYEVFAIWGSSANASDVNYRIRHREGETSVLVEQDGMSSAGQWVSLGLYSFERGRSADAGVVEIATDTVSGKPRAESAGQVSADAVLFIYRSPAVSGVGEWMLY